MPTNWNINIWKDINQMIENVNELFSSITGEVETEEAWHLNVDVWGHEHIQALLTCKLAD